MSSGAGRRGDLLSFLPSWPLERALSTKRRRMALPGGRRGEKKAVG